MEALELVQTLFGINVLLSFIVPSVAGLRGRSAAGFFWLSIVIGFVLTMIILLVTPRLEIGRFTRRVPCPYCAEDILSQATLCKHCGSQVEPKAEIV
jgi:tetrahydromethanopterin S-methyltransferase subunit E